MRVFVLSLLLLLASGQAIADTTEGDQALAAKDYPGAIAAYQAALAQEPDNLNALRQLGVAYYDSGDKARSLGVYEAAAAKQPGDASVQRFVDALKAQGVTAVPYVAPSPLPPSAAAGPWWKKFGVRGGLGYGLPTSTSGLGSDLSTGVPYVYGPGGGLSFGAELLWAFRPQLELGLGLQSIGNSAGYNSQSYNGVAKDDFKVDGSVIPIDLTLYAVVPASPRLNWLLGFGPALVLGGNYNTSDLSSNPALTSKTTSKALLDFGLGYHALLAAEYKFGGHFSVLAGLDLESVDVFLYKEVGSTVLTNSSGVVTVDQTYEIEYVSDAPKLKATTFSSSGTVSTSDDGVKVIAFDSATGKTTIKEKRGKSSTIDFNRVAPVLRVTYRF